LTRRGRGRQSRADSRRQMSTYTACSIGTRYVCTAYTYKNGRARYTYHVARPWCLPARAIPTAAAPRCARESTPGGEGLTTRNASSCRGGGRSGSSRRGWGLARRRGGGHEVRDGLLEGLDALRHGVDARDDRVGHGLEAALDLVEQLVHLQAGCAGAEGCTRLSSRRRRWRPRGRAFAHFMQATQKARAYARTGRAARASRAGRRPRLQTAPPRPTPRAPSNEKLF
jgi:hypothetical protein